VGEARGARGVAGFFHSGRHLAGFWADEAPPPCKGSLNLAGTCPASKPIFATAPYEADEAGVLRVQLPERCVHAGAAETCSLSIDHHRPRKTGPGFPLAVVGCSRHPVGRYTLYPPGHVPYGRQAVVPCSPSGPLQQDRASGEPPWPPTLFGAAVDAAAGDWWLSHWSKDDLRRRRSQGRHLQRAGHLLGIHPDIDSRIRERVATRLRVPTMALRSAAQAWSQRWQAQGSAVVTILATLPIDGSLLDRVLAAGMVAGLWPRPQRWDAERQTWVRARVGARSGSLKHPVPEASQSRAPPPTTSRTPGSPAADVASDA
jgi:hypothetical protein